MNKKGANNNILIYGLIGLLILFFAYQGGWLGQTTSDVDDGDVPSDLQTTLELTFKDDLATSDTMINASWLIFNGDGTLYKSGTATSGTDSTTARIKRNYDMYAYTTGESGYIAKKVSFKTDSDPIKAVTTKLIKRGGFTIDATQDPIDIDQNISGTLGSTEEIQIKWKVNVSNSGSRAPIMVLETNSTSKGVEDVSMTKSDNSGGTYTSVSCPDRLSPSATSTKLYCFERDSYAYASDGTIVSYASIKFDDSTAVGDEDWIQAKVIDTALYLEPGYDSIDGVLFGAEDSSDSDIGAGDSNTQKTHFND